MNKLIKNSIFAVTLIFTFMLFGITNVNAETVTGVWSTGINYSYDTTTGVLILTSNGSTTVEESTVVYDEYSGPEASINEPFSNISRIVISEGITSIGDLAFANWNYAYPAFRNNLTIEIPSSITSIGDWAFSSITRGSVSVIMNARPSNITTFYTNAFNDSKNGEFITPYVDEWKESGKCSYDSNTNKITFNNTYKGIFTITSTKYTVTFKDYDGSVLKTQENVEFNTGATAPSNPTRDHYTFTGWDKSFDKVTEDLVVTAQYIADKNTVTFDSNGGSAIDSQLVDYGSKVTKPSNPTNGNLHFIGWFVNPTLENIFNEEKFEYNTFDFNTKIIDDIKLTALWATRLNINTYGDGQIATASHGEELVFDDEYSITSVSELAIIGLCDSFDVEAKANEGYHFVKWTKDGVDYSKNSKVTITLEDDILELVAVFEVDEFTVTFKDYDGSTIDTQQVAYYTSAFEPDAPTREGYTFIGWDKSFDNVTKDLVVTAQYVLTPGEVEVKEVEGNVGSATVSLNNQNVEDLIELSADEQNAIATGKDIYVFVEVGDISDSVSIKDKELVKTKLEDGSVVGMYLDINLFKQIEGENKIKVEETNDKIKISFEIPEGLRSSNREFYIIRAHGSEVTKIVPSINGNILTFETDRFSTYALAYTDSVEDTTPTQTNTTSSPKTGDNVMLYISMLGLSIIGFIGTGLYVIKKRFN